MNTILVLITIIFLICFIIVLWKYLKISSLEKIRTDVYKLFKKAEGHIQETGLQKMKWVLSLARKLLPEWAQLIITDKVLETTVQLWYDGVKDFLDDGKINNSEQE